MNATEAARQITTCTVLVVPGAFAQAEAVARARECGESAYRATFAACDCGHSGWDGQCDEHAEWADTMPWEVTCRECNAAGHYCQMDIKVKAAVR